MVQGSKGETEMTIYTDEALKVEEFGNWVGITQGDEVRFDTVTLTRDEAIAAARAILAHYKEPV